MSHLQVSIRTCWLRALRQEAIILIAQRTSKVRNVVERRPVAPGIALMRAMLCLALLAVGAIPATSAAALQGNIGTPPQRVYASTTTAIRVSDDGGSSWTQAGVLPSRPLAMAVALDTPGLLFVGTESLGLLRSNDGAASWQPADNSALSRGNIAPLAVTALAIDPEDEQIVYAATNIWLGTHTAQLSPLGVAVSVDGGRQWIQLSSALLGDSPLQRLEPIAGQPLAVVTVNSSGRHTISLALSPELLSLLQDVDPAIRASAARAIGLIGDSAALPRLLQALSDPDALAGQRIAEAIGRIGDLSVSADLLQILGSAPAAERARAAQALGLLHSEAAVPGLAALLGDGDAEAQRVTAEALAAIGTPAAMTALMAPLTNLRMTSARHVTMDVLETVGQPAVAAVVAALGDSSPVVRANAAEMLGWLTPVEDPLLRADAVAALSRLRSDPDPTVQAQAAWALGEALAPTLARAPGDTSGSQGGAVANALPAQLALSAAPLSAAPLDAAPAATSVVPADHWSLAALAAISGLASLVMLAMFASALIWKGPRRHARPS